MSLNWSWNKKCGEAVFEQRGKEFSVNLYQGNAYMIFIYEYKEDGKDMYNLYTFWADKAHAKRCLGLEKDSEGVKYNLYCGDESDRLKKIRLNKAKCRHFAEIVGLLAKAFDNLEIEIYSEQ